MLSYQIIKRIPNWFPSMALFIDHKLTANYGDNIFFIFKKEFLS